MSVFCCKCGSFDLVHMKGYNKCSFCGNSINDRKYKNFKNKKIFAFKNDKTKSLKEYTKQNLNEKIYPFLKTKDSKHLAEVELIDSIILCVPYTKIKFSYSFDFEYVAVDLEEQAYTVHERVYGGTPLTGRPTFGSLDFERSYTEPVTKYKTVEKNRRKIEDSAAGSVSHTFLSTSTDNQCRSKIPEKHNGVNLMEDIILNREKKLGKIINSLSNNGLLNEFSSVEEYQKVIKKSICDSEDFDLKICTLDYNYSSAKNRFEENIDLSQSMFDTAKNWSALGDKNTNYKIWNEDTQYIPKETIVDTYLLQAFKTNENIFLCLLNLEESSKNFVKREEIEKGILPENNKFVLKYEQVLNKLARDTSNAFNSGTERLLIEPKNLNSKIKWLRPSYYKPSLIFTVLAYINYYIKEYLLPSIAQSNPNLIEENFGSEYIGLTYLIVFGFWIWSVFKERNTYKSKTREILDKKLEIINSNDNRKLSCGESKMKLDWAQLESNEIKYKIYKFRKYEISIDKLLIYIAIAVPILDLILGSFNYGSLFLALIPTMSLLSFGIVGLLVLEKILKIEYRNYIINILNLTSKKLFSKIKKQKREDIKNDTKILKINKSKLFGASLAVLIYCFLGLSIGNKIQKVFINKQSSPSIQIKKEKNNSPEIRKIDYPPKTNPIEIKKEKNNDSDNKEIDFPPNTFSSDMDKLKESLSEKENNIIKNKELMNKVITDIQKETLKNLIESNN